jgi:hypothetical protein
VSDSITDAILKRSVRSTVVRRIPRDYYVMWDSPATVALVNKRTADIAPFKSLGYGSIYVPREMLGRQGLAFF